MMRSDPKAIAVGDIVSVRSRLCRTIGCRGSAPGPIDYGTVVALEPQEAGGPGVRVIVRTQGCIGLLSTLEESAVFMAAHPVWPVLSSCWTIVCSKLSLRIEKAHHFFSEN